MNSAPTYLAIDLETTGLAPDARILEIAAAILDSDLEQIGPMFSCTIADTYFAIEDCEPDALAMHTEAGLICDGAVVPATNDWTLGHACTYLCELLRYFPEPAILAGHSIDSDRRWLTHWMPELARRLSHRLLDARPFQLIAPDLSWPERTGTKHRAAADLEHSIAVLRFARERMRGATC